MLKEPEYAKTSLAGVKCYEGEIEIEGRKLRLGKQTHKDWNSASLYFDWQESVEKMQHDSTIKKIDSALSNSPFEHTLIDYGILNREELKKIGGEK